MTTKSPAAKRRTPCPRCKLGFIIFEGSFDGESSCLNCGYHVPAAAPNQWLGEFAATGPLYASGQRQRPARPQDAPPA